MRAPAFRRLSTQLLNLDIHIKHHFRSEEARTRRLILHQFHMKKILILCCTLALGSPLAYAQQTQTMSANELVAKNIEAKGGTDALHALQSIKLTGKVLV